MSLVQTLPLSCAQKWWPLPQLPSRSMVITMTLEGIWKGNIQISHPERMAHVGDRQLYVGEAKAIGVLSHSKL